MALIWSSKIEKPQWWTHQQSLITYYCFWKGVIRSFSKYISHTSNPWKTGSAKVYQNAPLQPLKRNLQPKKPRYLLRPTEQKGWWVRFLCQTKMTLSFYLYHTNHTLGEREREPRNLYGSPLGDYNQKIRIFAWKQ